MRIRRVEIVPYALPLRTPLRTGAGTLHMRAGVLLRLTTDEGLVGLGDGFSEAASGVDATARSLRAVAREFLDRRLDSPGDFRDCEAWIDELADPAARAAADGALLDLSARTRSVSLAVRLSEELGGRPRERVTVNALLAGGEPPEVAASAREAVAAGFRTLKLKVAARTVARDEARVAAVREAVGDAVSLRLDANGGWNLDEARRALERWARFDLEFVEQPVAPGDPENLARVRRDASVPIAADEGARTLDELERLIGRDAIDAVVVKPSLVGPRRSLALVRAARSAGVDVVVTSALESKVGRTHALQVAAALGAAPAAGLATAGWLTADLGRPERVADGAIETPKDPGLGIELDDEALERAATGEAWSLP